ncbi:MAG: sodium-translocating pyrophosphatase [Anaerolineae bacterium]
MDGLWLAAGSSVLSLLIGGYLFRWVRRQELPNVRMQEIAAAIREGANAYLVRLYVALAGVVAVVGALVLAFLGWRLAVAYVAGSLFSALAGFFGMGVALQANARTAWAARRGLNKAFGVAFFGGGVMGMSVVGLALLGMSVVYLLFRDPGVVLGFSFGASSLALLAKAGGGIYTKTADIGADLVGKVELSIPEDDPRNPAVIADNVGDNVGDVAGMGADIFDSYVASAVAVMILGRALFPNDVAYVLLPLVLSAAGVWASVLGMLFVRVGRGGDPGMALNFGTIITCVIFAALAVGAVRWMGVNVGALYATLAGLAVGVIIGFTSDLFTSERQGIVQATAESSKTGAALNILTGFSYGLLSILPSLIGICAAMLVAWYVAEGFGIPGVYGVSLSAVGMLAVTGMIVSADAYGPIVDNAKGIAEQAGMAKEVVDVADKLDAAGNTAKAITKGFAIGAAGLTVLALFAAYAETVGLQALDLKRPVVIVGVFLGAAMPPLFSALTILSVSRNAFAMVNEVRRQFREIKGLLEGLAKPDYARCVGLAAQGAMKELILPGGAALIVPVLTGFVLGPEALGGLLAGSIVSGLVFALFMANAGGLWDNAKKYIEGGACGGSGSDAHKAAVVGDTVGDPFKDTAGPSINTLITVMSLVATLIAPLLVGHVLLPGL